MNHAPSATAGMVIVAESPHGAWTAEENVSWRGECLRSVAVVAVSAAVALGLNCLTAKPVPLLASDGPGSLPERALRINVEDLRTLLASGRAVLLLDVRRDEPFQAGHAVGALPAPADDFAAHYQNLNLSTRLLAAEDIILVCESDDCPSADRVAKFLKDLQHANVRVIYGGWQAYAQAGLPVEAAAR